ncbi:hypothetical protein SO694_00008182 [Aureococcus anophagefferens]|uniref:Nucleotide-diphospho-sugar transferase domain-containing protein n=1 Tax=Aureococcus anophagefferens TaxID=44056 RepID=A0ABR1GE43_AURAN
MIPMLRVEPLWHCRTKKLKKSSFAAEAAAAAWGGAASPAVARSGCEGLTLASDDNDACGHENLTGFTLMYSQLARGGAALEAAVLARPRPAVVRGAVPQVARGAAPLVLDAVVARALPRPKRGARAAGVELRAVAFDRAPALARATLARGCKWQDGCDERALVELRLRRMERLAASPFGALYLDSDALARARLDGFFAALGESDVAYVSTTTIGKYVRRKTGLDAIFDASALAPGARRYHRDYSHGKSKCRADTKEHYLISRCLEYGTTCPTLADALVAFDGVAASLDRHAPRDKVHVMNMSTGFRLFPLAAFLGKPVPRGMRGVPRSKESFCRTRAVAEKKKKPRVVTRHRSGKKKKKPHV